MLHHVSPWFGRKKERARVSILGTDPIQLNGVHAAKQDKVAHQRRNRQIAATLRPTHIHIASSSHRMCLRPEWFDP